MKDVMLNFAGTVFVVVAAWFLYNAFQIDVTVPNPGGIPERVVNAQLVHVVEMDILIGVGSALIAAIFFGTAAVVSALEANRGSN